MIRPARPDDVGDLIAGIRALAAYERLEHELETDEQALHDHLFGEPRHCEAWVAEPEPGAFAGFALVATVYSTFKTRPCLHLEDLFVSPEYRGRGLGEALLRTVAAVAHERGHARLGWQVLDWNAPAIGFYRRLGAELLEDWRMCRVEGGALERLARDFAR